jgi:hypothetical protein
VQECIADSFSQRSEVLDACNALAAYKKIVLDLYVGRSAGQPEEYLNAESAGDDGVFVSLRTRRYSVAELFLALDVDLHRVARALTEVNDSKFEIAILEQVVGLVNPNWFADQFSNARSQIYAGASERPRFALNLHDRLVAFPEGARAEEPSDHHFKAARKQMALIAKAANVNEGYFELEEAKGQLNRLRNAMVADLDSRCLAFDGTKALPFLVEKIEALQYDYWEKVTNIKLSLNHVVDYDRAERIGEYREKFLRNHKNYRYLIEKFVALGASGKQSLDVDLFGELIAFVDWLLVVYVASDSVHYGLHPVGLTIGHELTFSVQYPKELSGQEDAFRKQESEDELDSRGNPADVVEYDGTKDQILSTLDVTFVSDTGFRFTSLLGFLQVLYRWPELRGIDPKACYFATKQEILTELAKSVKGWDEREGEPLLRFMSLSKEGLTRLIGDTKPCADIPVWEHIKRGQRYVIAPLLPSRGCYVWGPCSARKAASIWQGNAVAGKLPASYAFLKTQAALLRVKRGIENALVVRALEIAERFTNCVEKEVDLFRRFPDKGFPQELGDYDVLAYLEQSQILLSVECKDNTPAYCLKDATRLREEIFGENSDDQSQVYKIRRRHEFLKSRPQEIQRLMKWPAPATGEVRLISLYVSRRTYWWFRNPPYAVDIAFVRIDELNNFIKSLS